MVKKLLRFLCLALMLCALPLVSLAAPAMVVDDADLFTASEIRQMEDVIQTIIDTYQMDVVVLTSRSAPYDDTQDFADRYYEDNGYGMGSDRSGLLYFIDMHNRVPCLSTAGTMADYITDGRRDELFDVSYDQLAAGRYGQSTLTLLNRLVDFLEEGRLEGSFRYDVETGQRLSGVYNKLTGSEALFAGIAGLAVALVLWFTVSFRYNLKGKTYHYHVDDHCTRKLTTDDEQFLRQTVSRMPKSQGNGGGGGGGHGGGGLGSGMHTSSGGMSHGGGVGRGF